MTPEESRAVLHQLEHEQQEITQAIREWRAWWNEIRNWGIPRFGEMASRLNAIRDQLQAHFERAERVGCLGAPAKRAQAQERARRLKAEHSGMLTELASLVDHFRNCPCDESCWGDARADFEAFLTRLDDYERRETELIKMALAANAEVVGD